MSRNADLRKYAEMLNSMENRIIRDVGAMDAKRAKSLRAALSRLTQTNCWWAEYRVSQHFRVALRHRETILRASRLPSAERLKR